MPKFVGYVPRLRYAGFTLCLICNSLSNAQADSKPVISQGDALIHADTVRSSHGLNGEGITVGVISDSFNCLGGAGKGIEQHELPTEVTVIQEADCRNEDTLDEGRAMLEIIHDITPKAKLLFHAMGNNPIEFNQALNRMADGGAQIIVDDAVFFQEPMFQDGLAAQIIDKLVFERGIGYFSSAGNAGTNSYQRAFSDSQLYPLGIEQGLAHDFNEHPQKTDTCQSITVGANTITVLTLQWDQAAKSISGAPGAASDLNVVLYDNPQCTGPGAGQSIGGSTDNLGADPIEVVAYDNTGKRQRKTLGLQILLVAGPPPKLMKYILSGSSLPSEHPSINEHNTPNASNSVFGHANARGAFIVGAVDVPLSQNKQPFQLSYYSSKGGIPILFDQQGQRLDQPLIRHHVDAVSPTNVNTSFFSTIRPDVEGDGKPNFTGTSAAAPHAAAVGALLLQAASRKGTNLNPQQLYDLLQRSSLDLGAPGYDFATGYGLIQADRALQLLQEQHRANQQ